MTAMGNHITISVDGNKVVDYIDQTMSPELSSGAVVMHTEDLWYIERIFLLDNLIRISMAQVTSSEYVLLYFQIG